MLAISLRRALPLALALLLGIGLLAVAPSPARATDLADRQSTTLSMTVDSTTTPVMSHAIADLTLTVVGGGRPDGDIDVLVDGVVIETLKARPSQWVELPTEALGPHTVVAHYRGSTTLAPSDSEKSQYTVTLADTTTELNFAEETATKEDVISFDVRATNSDAPRTKPVSVIEDGVVLDEIDLSAWDGQYGEFALAGLPLGEHTLRFDYPGDANTNASHAIVTFTMVEVKPVVELSIKLDHEVVHYGSTVEATVGAKQTAGEPVELTGDISFFLDDELVTTRPVTEVPVTVEFPVGGLGDHTIRAELDGTESYEATSTYWPFHVIKAPTRIEVNTSHPYHRSDVLEISVLSDGPVNRGRVNIGYGETGFPLDVINGKAELPLKLWGRGLGRHTLDLEYVDFGDDSKFERSIATAKIMVVPKVGDTSISATVDRRRPAVGTGSVKATVTVNVEGGAAPEGVLEYHSYWGGDPIVVDAGPSPVTIELPTALVGESGRVTFVPSSPDQEESTVSLDFLVTTARTATRVTAPSTPIAAGSRLPVSVDVLDSPIAPRGRVLVTDGAPDCEYDEVYGKFDLPVCTNDVAVVGLDDAGLDLTGLTTGRHDLVFWYLALQEPGAPPFGAGAAARTEPSRTTVPITITEAPGTALSVDRESTIAGGAAVTVTATLDGDADPEGEITFFVDGKQHAVRPVAADPVTLSLPVDVAGAHQVTASYTGSQRGEGPRSAAVGYTVAKAQTTTTASAAAGAAAGVLDVTVSATDSAVVPGGRVQVIEGSTTLGFVELTAGRGRFVPSRLPGGDHALTFRYVGDASTEESTKSGTFHLPALATTTRLTLDRVKSAVGTTTTMTADIATSDGDAASGSATFLVDGRAVGTADLRAGRAQVKVPVTKVGPHQITARLIATEAYAASTSVVQSIVVSAATAAIQAKTKRLKSGRLRVVATIAATAPVSGRVFVLQRVRTKTTHGKVRTRLVRIAGTTIRRSGTRVTVVLRTKKLRTPVRPVVLRYAGSSTVNAVERSIRLPRRR